MLAYFKTTAYLYSIKTPKNLFSQMPKKHGGKRANAGRKKLPYTDAVVYIRVNIDYVQGIKKVVKQYIAEQVAASKPPMQ